MSEQIKELVFKAGAKLYSEPPMRQVTGVSMSFESVEKFIELIVRECMEVAIHKDDGMISTADIAGYMASGRVSAAKMIAKHFGLEE